MMTLRQPQTGGMDQDGDFFFKLTQADFGARESEGNGGRSELWARENYKHASGAGILLALLQGLGEDQTNDAGCPQFEGKFVT